MEVKIIREVTDSKKTEGKLYIEDKFFCKTYELADVGLDDKMGEASIKDKKKSKCAIPTGTYRMTANQRSSTLTKLPAARDFNMRTPIIHGVKCFKNVCIHPKQRFIHFEDEWNGEIFAEGCIILGNINGNNKTYLAWKRFMKEITGKGIITLTIERNYKE